MKNCLWSITRRLHFGLIAIVLSMDIFGCYAQQDQTLRSYKKVRFAVGDQSAIIVESISNQTPYFLVPDVQVHEQSYIIRPQTTACIEKKLSVVNDFSSQDGVKKVIVSCFFYRSILDFQPVRFQKSIPCTTDDACTARIKLVFKIDQVTGAGVCEHAIYKKS